MMPLPQRPTGFWPGSPMMPNVGSIVSGSMTQDSIAPSVARMPQEMSPPLEGRACRAGARDHEIAVAENDLAVRAEVDEQGQLVAVPEHAGERTGGDIAADIRADVRRKADGGVRMRGQAEVVHAQAVPVEEGGDIRLHADGIGVHADEQVVHRRVV